MAASAFDVSSLTQAGRAAGYPLPDGWQPIPERIQSSNDDWELSTRQTIERMCQHVHEAQTDDLIRSIAARTRGLWGASTARQIAWDVFWFCKHQVRFILDEAAVQVLFNESDQVDFLVSPSVLMRMPRPAGDCDDFTMLACSLLEGNRIPWEIVTIAADGSQPGRWSHVYCRAICADGRRLVLDPTNGAFPGWEVPQVDIQRKQVWDSSGKPIADAAPIQPARMHAYQARGMGQDWTTGAVAAADVAYPGSTSSTVLDPSLLGFQSQVPTIMPSVSASASSSSDWVSTLLTQLGRAGTTLGTLALVPTGGTITTLPNGTQVVTNQAAAPSLGTLGSSSFSVSSLVLIAGIALVGIFVLKAAK